MYKVKKESMKVKDLIKLDIDIEVYDSITDEILNISFVGPCKLTKEGEQEFKEVLEYDVSFYEKDNYAVVICTDEGTKIKGLTKAKKAACFFKACAGYCPTNDYDKWFKE